MLAKSGTNSGNNSIMATVVEHAYPEETTIVNEHTKRESLANSTFAGGWNDNATRSPNETD